MPIINVTREDIEGFPLDEERHELLSFLADLDLAHRPSKYVRPLINERLQEIEQKRRVLGLKESDPSIIAEALDEERD